MRKNFVAAVTAPGGFPGPALWFIFSGFQLLVTEDSSGTRVPWIVDPAELDLTIQRRQYLGHQESETGSTHVYTAEVAADSLLPMGMGLHGLRSLFGRLDETMLALAGRAVQIIEWDRTHQFCGRCAVPVEALPDERAKRCPACGLTTYPRLSPAIIVAVERPGREGAELLLARNRRHPAGFYSVLAGFVEPGESLEECVRREVCEEVGLELQDIRYFGSQPWPFPHSLMIAFTARYHSGEITLEADELLEAGWYRANQIPRVPPPVSIARQLIDSFVAKNS